MLRTIRPQQFRRHSRAGDPRSTGSAGFGARLALGFLSLLVTRCGGTKQAQSVAHLNAGTRGGIQLARAFVPVLTNW